MAEKCFIVAYDIQQAGASNAYFAKTEAPTGWTEAKIGNAEFEGKNSATDPTNGPLSGLYVHQGANVVQCKMVELIAKSAADAVGICREKFAQNPGGERAVEKPNETNFKVIL